MPASAYPSNGVLVGSGTVRMSRTANADTDEPVLGGDARVPSATTFAEGARSEVESMLTAGTGVTLSPSGSGATRQIQIAAPSASGVSRTFVIAMAISLG